jgi:hypothetical protein
MNQLESPWAKRRSWLARWSRVAATPDLPTIAFFRAACCCDVAYLSQAFSQPTSPGRLWISLSAILLQDNSWKMTESKHELKQ